MRTAFKKTALTTLILVVAGLATVAHAFVADVDIISPSDTQYVPGFPANINVTLSIDLKNSAGNCVTNGIKSIEVTAQEELDLSPTLIHSADNPINNDTQTCPAPYSFVWSVPGPGNYTLVVEVNHGSDTGSEETTIGVVLLAVEWPAPPAVANAFLKEKCQKMKGGTHGAIISEIAYWFNQGDFNPKPGPYNETKIKEYVVNIAPAGSCSQ